MRRDRGLSSLELVLMTPVFLALLGLMFFLGRRATLQSEVREAAKVAAREATLYNDPAEGAAAGRIVGAATLAELSVSCRTPDVDVVVDLAGAVPVAIAEVSCTVGFGDLWILPVGGEETFRATIVEPVDQYRGT